MFYSQDLYGKVTFTNEEISTMRGALDSYGLPMPQFRKIGGILASEIGVDEAALHAAIIAVNATLDEEEEDGAADRCENPPRHQKCN